VNKLRKRDLLRIGLRLTLIQSTWSECGMQSEGLAYCLALGFKRIFSSPKDVDDAIKRYRTTFNTHPFLVGVVAGSVLRMEENEESPRKIASFLRSTMGPLAALGDPFFKNALAPAASAVAAVIALLWGLIPGVVSFLLLFNLVHLVVRIAGVFMGYKDGEYVMTKRADWIGSARTHALKTICSASCGFAMGLMAFRFFELDVIRTIIMGGLGCMFCAAVLKGRRSLWVYATPALLVTVFAMELVL
jgi:mannose/fructose/N-acetylgalactosamine-specific phosphotransferase system component IID